MEKISFPELLTAAVVLLVFIGAYNTIFSAIKNRREQKKWADEPITALTSRVEEQERRLESNVSRIEALEGELKDVSEQSRITMRGIKALLSHEINGNSDDKLRSSLDEIETYLINR